MLYLIVVSVGGAELGVRLLALAPPVPSQYVRYAADDILPFRPQVNDRWMHSGGGGEFEVEVRTNSLGFRDVEHSREKPVDVFRILALGDSFTFGVGAAFEDSYLVRLEEMLNERSGSHPAIEIIKAGVPRFWPEAEALLLERIGVSFDPDLVLVSFLPNDVADTVVGMDYLEVSEGFLLTRQADQLGRPGLWLFLHSHAARIVLQRYVVAQAGRSRSEPDDDVVFADIYRADGPYEYAWSEVEAESQRMIEIAASVGSDIAFVHIPQQNFEMESAPYPATRLGQWADMRDVTFIDTLPGIRRAAEHETLYWARDGHCTPAGYRVVAEQVFDGLIRAGKVP